MTTYTPFPVGPMPANVRVHEGGPPYGRLALDLDHSPRDGEVVTDRVSGERFRIRTGVDCGAGCACAAEARWTGASTVFVLGRDAVGTVAEDRELDPPFRYYLTECCGASAKGLEDYVGCRACYAEIDPSLGGCPDKGTVLVKHKPDSGSGIRDDVLDGWWVFVDVPLALAEVYGDGLPYDEWKARYLP